MLRITREGKTLLVPKGAFRELYSPLGWVVEGCSPTASQGPAMGSSGKGGVDTTLHPETPPDTPPNDPEPNKNLDEEGILQNMSEVELRQYASLLGIKTKDLKTREGLMKAIKSHKE